MERTSPNDHAAPECAIGLTLRQRQMVACVAAGMTECEIADLLAISPRTVRMHCDVVRSRLAVEKRRHIPAAYRQLTGLDPMELYDWSTAA